MRRTRRDTPMTPFAWLNCPDPKLAEALTYLAQQPGKQLRSQLTVTCAELVAGEPVAAATIAGEAIELLHTYSLVHDDLRWMTTTCAEVNRPCIARSMRPPPFSPGMDCRPPPFSGSRRLTR